MPFGGGDSEVIQKSEPWDEIKPYLLDAADLTQDYVYSWPREEYYSGDMVADIHPTLTAGLDLQKARAEMGSAAMSSAETGISAAGQGGWLGYSPTQQLLGNLAGGPTYAPTFGGWENLVNTGGNIYDTADAWMRQTAGGEMLNGNPYLDQMYDTAANRITRQYQTATAPSIDAAASGTGRYGSGAHARMAETSREDLADSLGGLASDIYGSAYQQERGLQEAAKSQLVGALSQDVQTRLSALQGGEQGYNAAAQRQIEAAKAMDQGYGHDLDTMARAWAAAPGVADWRYKDAAALAEVGTAYQNQAQREIDAAVNKHNWVQSRPLQRLGAYTSLLNGNPASSFIQTSQSVPGASPIGGILGGGMMGYGLGSGSGLGALMGAGMGLANAYGW